MKKLLLIAIILFGITFPMYAQTAGASASATIVNPVGAESTGDIKFGYLPNTTQKKSEGLITNNSYKVSTTFSSLKIIGSSFGYDISIQSEPVILKRNYGPEIIKINLSKELPLAVEGKTDEVNVPVKAILASNFSIKEGNYSSSFRITVNFN